MRHVRMAAAASAICLAFALLLPVRQFFEESWSYHTLEAVPSALSVQLPDDTSRAQVRTRMQGAWSDWQTFTVENEQDPLLRESNLVMIGTHVDRVQIRTIGTVALHPIVVDATLPSYDVAARSTQAKRILSRSDWGADESLRMTTAPAGYGVPSGGTETAGTPTQRVQDCMDAQRDFPDEFTTVHPVTMAPNGQRYRWPLEYSPSIKLIAVHHTAIAVAGDKRSGAERVRALYAYHANNRGWGDIGYHYLIDEDGRIYEGRAGGPSVVAGHAYCHNVGTLGVALLGNFEEEKPTQTQLASLQWLLAHLTDEYGIDPTERTTVHGRSLPPIVGHGDLVSTECPGYYVRGSLAQIRTHVASGDLDALVRLPPDPVTIAARTAKDRTARIAARVAERTSKIEAPLNRAAQRLLDSTASQLLLRRLRRGATEQDVVTPAPARTTTPVRRTTSAASSRASRSSVDNATATIRIRLTRQETGASDCSGYDLAALAALYRGTVRCEYTAAGPVLINTVSIDAYMRGLGEEPDTEPYEKQRAFAIAARTYAAHYAQPENRKFPGMPYDGDDSPARFQLYLGKTFESRNPAWVRAVESTADTVLTMNGQIIRPPYFSSDDGRTRSPAEVGWASFPFAEIFVSKDDPWCVGQTMRGHGVGMSGCGAKGQALEGKSAEQILSYYYPGTKLQSLSAR